MTEYYCVLIGFILLCFKGIFKVYLTTQGDGGLPFLYSKENTQTACVYHFPDVSKMTGKPPTLLSRIYKKR